MLALFQVGRKALCDMLSRWRARSDDERWIPFEAAYLPIRPSAIGSRSPLALGGGDVEPVPMQDWVAALARRAFPRAWRSKKFRSNGDSNLAGQQVRLLQHLHLSRRSPSDPLPSSGGTTPIPLNTSPNRRRLHFSLMCVGRTHSLSGANPSPPLFPPFPSPPLPASPFFPAPLAPPFASPATSSPCSSG